MPSAGQVRIPQQQIGDADHRHWIVHQHHAMRAAHRGEGIIAAGEARGMRSRGAHAVIGLAGLQHHHRLAGAPARRRGAREAGRIAQALDVDAHRIGGGIVDEVFEEVADLQVRLVAQRHAGAEADALARGAVEQRDHQRAALADQADAPGQQTARCPARSRSTAPAAQPGLIRPMQFGPTIRMPAGVRDVQNALLQFRAGLIGLGKAGGDDHAAAHAGGSALLDRRQKLAGGHCQDRHVHARRRIGQMRDRRCGRGSPCAAD